MFRIEIIKKQIISNRSFNLIELLVTLGIMIILLTMISNIFVEVMRINLINKERAFVREESSTLIAMIKKDIRNSDKLVSCEGVDATGGFSNDCTFLSSGKTYEWVFSPVNGDYANLGYYVANKYIIDPNNLVNPKQSIYQSADGIFFSLSDDPAKPDKKAFNILTDPNNQSGQITVLIKLVCSSVPGDPSSSPAVDNVIKQTIISARNFNSN